jgi:hypothetical protein
VKRPPPPPPPEVYIPVVRIEERLPSIFTILYEILAGPIIDLYRQYKDYFKVRFNPWITS